MTRGSTREWFEFHLLPTIQLYLHRHYLLGLGEVNANGPWHGHLLLAWGYSFVEFTFGEDA